MAKERILIVEDEQIVAEDLKRIVEKLGYIVVGKAANGKEALALAEQMHPQMVLMDIRLEGPMDGIETAEHIYTHFDIPVSYLTAYADRTTLERAKATMPFGYILKPFDERHLETTIELALFRHKMEKVFKQLDHWQASALQNLSEAVVVLDGREQVAFMNRAAETLLDRTLDSEFGKPFDQVLQFAKNDSSLVFIQRNGQEIMLRCSRSPMKDADGKAIGSVLALKEVLPAPSKITRAI
ncbi:MAG: hypothetical protein A2901_06730 [Elusimicrobia bacterium RIFCSPLOWO2_01_FULL_54_10]|nr:MAG: hypothetical protein A2901_06730 [Elusimicrobia bacterium RIFCSPLOWO2_01_FULL_54_10]